MGQLQLEDARTASGNYLLLRIPGDPNRIVLYECLIPYLKPDTSWDFLNFKFPMFFVAFFIVFIYQYCYKKKGSGGGEEADGSGLFSGIGPGGKKLTPKAKKDLQEIEGMIKSLGSLGKGMDGMKGLI